MENVIRRFLIALTIGSSITLLEFIGGILSNSIALISDSGHMLVDVMAIALGLFAVKLSQRSHTQRLTYGYHRAEILASLANGLMLLVISLMIIIEAYNRLISQSSIDAFMLINVAAIGLLANIGMIYVLKDVRKSSLGAKSAFLHIITDTLSSVAVIVSGLIIYSTKIYIADPILAFGISALIIRSAFLLLRDCIHILLEGTPLDIDLKDIAEAIKSVNGILDLHDLHVWTISTGLYALSAHVIVRDQMVSESAAIIEEVKAKMRSLRISHVTIQIEPEKRIKDLGRL